MPDWKKNESLKFTSQASMLTMRSLQLVLSIFLSFRYPGRNIVGVNEQSKSRGGGLLSSIQCFPGKHGGIRGSPESYKSTPTAIHATPTIIMQGTPIIV